MKIPSARSSFRFFLIWSAFAVAAQTPEKLSFSITNRQPLLRFAPAPAVQRYSVESAASPHGPFLPVAPPVRPDFSWLGGPAQSPSEFFRVRSTEMTPARLVATTLLNRIAYGPLPGDVDRVVAMGPEAYIEEQLAPETIPEDLDAPSPPTWQKVTAVGTGPAAALTVYLDGPGEIYMDDLRLVAGVGDDGSLPNLVRDGDFETPLAGAWSLGSSVATSARSTAFVHGGSYSLHVPATTSGGSAAASLVQSLSAPLNPALAYTLSFWYLPLSTGSRQVVCTTGAGLRASAAASATVEAPAPLYAALAGGAAGISDLRAWHLRSVIQSKRQFAEVLRQFFENHFVTEYSKSYNYLSGAGQKTGVDAAAAGLEFSENLRWRAALMNPQVTFHDLLKISAESPAMIIYLDTAGSRGDGGNIPNENYARELNELFCFGVNNGYDQNDIVQISRIWSGWSLDFVASNQVDNPFAPRSTNYLDPNALTNRTAITNLLGVWAFNYKAARHSPQTKHVFFNWSPAGGLLQGKTVPARFGPPWAGRDYSLTIQGGTTTNAIQEGYTLLRHMADQPFTEEFISVKLCRLLVHENFQFGYDFTDPNLSAEGRLVLECMKAWETPPNGGPKGQLRWVLRTILRSPLFWSNQASMQKVKTPLEFAASLVRAFRIPGAQTAVCDGYGVLPFLDRAGGMRLFDRQDPDGYPEDGASWISAGTLVERSRFAAAALEPNGYAGKSDAAGVSIDPVAVVDVEAPAALTDAGALADYFLGLLFPAEGAGNLGAYRAAALTFLDAPDGVSNLPFSQLKPGTAAHGFRVRGLCAWLLGTQRFQEQ